MKGLCYRCEHRAQYLETGRRPRYECGLIEEAKHSCYMFIPAKPVFIERNEGEKRPITLDVFSGRFHVVDEEPNLQLSVITTERKYILPIWELKIVKNHN